METYIQDIEFINKYINGQLSGVEKSDFEKRLQADKDFNSLYQEHLDFVNGFKRVVLKQDISAARQSYIKSKWFKNLGIPVLVIGVSVLCYSLFFHTTDVVESSNPVVNTELESVITVTDTTKTIKVIEEETSSIKGVLVPEESSTETETSVEVIQPEEAAVITEVKEMVSVEKETKREALLEEGLSPDMISFYKSVKKAPQVLLINTEKDTIVTCKEGTKLVFEAKSFVDATTNRLARGKITIEVTEFYKLSDMLLANLSTKSDEDQIETGGMLLIDANKKGRKLNLKSDKSVEIRFPKKIHKTGMHLFNGDFVGNNINWKSQLQDVLITEELEIKKPLEEDVEVPYAVIENVPVYPGCENGDNQQRKDCMSRAIQQFIQRNFDTEVAVESGLTGRQKISVIFKIDKEGFITSVRSRAPHPLLEREAVRVVNLLPPMKPGMQRGKAVIVPYSLPIIFQTDGDTQGFLGNSNDRSQTPILIDKKTTEKLEIKIENGKVADVSKSELNWYVFRSSNLGWINCDRFIRSRKPKMKLKLKIKNSDGADVKLIFKNINSILPGKKMGNIYNYGNVPKDEAIVLIAIKKVDDSFYLAVKDGNTDILSDIDLDFNQVSIQEMKKKIEALNLSF